MGSLLLHLQLLSAADSGLFSTLGTGSKNLQNQWDTVATFGGSILIIFAVIFLCIAVAKSRDKARWYWSSAIAFVIGAILIMKTATSKIEGSFGGTWDEVFGASNFVNFVPLASAAAAGGAKGLLALLPIIF